jgi:hypothetical protein
LWASFDRRTRELASAVKILADRAAAVPLDEYAELRLDVDERRIDWDLACALLDGHIETHGKV